MVNTIGARIRVTPSYWRFLCGRAPVIGDIHVAEGISYSVTDIIEDGARTIILLSKRQVRKGVRRP